MQSALRNLLLTRTASGEPSSRLSVEPHEVAGLVASAETVRARFRTAIEVLAALEAVAKSGEHPPPSLRREMTRTIRELTAGVQVLEDLENLLLGRRPEGASTH